MVATSLEQDLACALDPVRFAADLGIAADPWQAAVLRSAAPRMLLNCSRQSGKSTIAALLGLHTALYTPHSLVLLVSPSLRQSQELAAKVFGYYHGLGATVPALAESALRVELANGSRIVALPGTEATIRGYSAVRLLIFDESARCADALYHACRPFLAVSGGRLLALSTPYGKRGWWYTAWQDGGAAWDRVEIPAAQCPRIPPDFLAQERASLPPWVYRQEYGCVFEEAEDAAFAASDIAAAFDPTLEPIRYVPVVPLPVA